MNDQYTIATGLLPVGSSHEVYWEDWGNPDVNEPFFFLHGGPGGGCKPKHKALFDPSKQRVVFHDQRGSGRSTPLGHTDQNTTQDLISDIEYLREMLELKKINLVGGSWGSTLSLSYALEHPKRVKSMTLWGIFLAREIDDQYHYGGLSSKHTYPEVWQRFIKNIPKPKQADATSIIEYYYSAMQSGTNAAQQAAAIEWTLFEASLLGIEPDTQGILSSLTKDPEATLMFARLESHYFKNKCFLPKNFILNNVEDIKHIPTHIVHGRQDAICAPSAAFDLAAAIDGAKLHMVSGGHRGDSGKVGAVVKALLTTIES